LAYWPPVEKLYSQTGCKKVKNLVKFFYTQEKYMRNDNIQSNEEEANENNNIDRRDEF
jgi:hypothetical protein